MIVGIDLGATKTHVRAERDGEISHDFVITTKELLGDLPVDHPDSVLSLVRVLSRIDGIEGAIIVIGAHGLDSPDQCRTFTELLRESHSGPVLAVNDAELLGPAAGLEDYIGVVVGTGSKVVARNSAGEPISAGGFGHLFSDAGSAGGLVREAMRAILQRCDAGQPAEPLGLCFMNRLDVADEVELAQRLTADPRLSSWATLAPLVFEATDAGSKLGVSVINDAAAALATSVSQLVSRGAVGSHVVCAGGVIARQPRLLEALADRVEKFGLGLNVGLLATDPVHGAIVLGKRIRA